VVMNAEMMKKYEEIVERIAQANKALSGGNFIQVESPEWNEAQAELKSANYAMFEFWQEVNKVGVE